jgi:hypothetical protein
MTTKSQHITTYRFINTTETSYILEQRYYVIKDQHYNLTFSFHYSTVYLIIIFQNRGNIRHLHQNDACGLLYILFNKILQREYID